ncbi:DUF1648 domain-containing protein [bacterium]|nr:MAG: DUF1648 domain-containing protein [bacterium]
MKIRQTLAIQLAAVGVAAVASLVMAPRLPARVPIHWGISGQPDGWGSPSFALWFGPSITLLMLGLTLGVPWLPGGKNVARFGPTFGKTMALISGFFAFLHIVILQATAKGGDLPTTFMVGLFLFFAALGNLMGKIRPNPYMGVRTPWTMKSERVWEATHRRAAWIFVGGGLFGAVLVALGASIAVALPLILLISFAPILDSYLLYRKIEG